MAAALMARSRKEEARLGSQWCISIHLDVAGDAVFGVVVRAEGVGVLVVRVVRQLLLRLALRHVGSFKDGGEELSAVDSPAELAMRGR